MTRVPTRTTKEHIPGHEVSLSTYLNWGCRCEGCSNENRRNTHKHHRKNYMAWRWIKKNFPGVAERLLAEAEAEARRKYG